MAVIDLRAPVAAPDVDPEVIDVTCQACGYAGDAEAVLVDMTPRWDCVELTYRWTCPGPCGAEHHTYVVEDGHDS